MTGVHAQVKAQIEKFNALSTRLPLMSISGGFYSRKGSLYGVILSKERQPYGHYMQLNDRRVGPCEVLRKIRDNAYQVKLPPHLSISDVFNVQHLVPYVSSDS